MERDLDSEKELGLEPSHSGINRTGMSGGAASNSGMDTKAKRMTVPPTPPAKDISFPTPAFVAKSTLIRENGQSAQEGREERTAATTGILPPLVGPAALNFDIPRPGTGLSTRSNTGTLTRPGTSSSEATNRPLAPRPTIKTLVDLDLSRPSSSASEPPNRPLPRPPKLAAMLRPQAPLAMNPPTRPGTAASNRTTATRMVGSTKRLSFSSIASGRSPIKYGQGKFANVELNPQPSDDPDDPLNWPQWKKELNFGALLLMVAMIGAMKTIFVTVNSLLAEQFLVSYTATAALTGVPLILSAFTGFASLVGARIWGKRPFYLASLLLVFIGAVWNTNVNGSYAQCMAARVFQGLGWGAFDTLVLGSIHDTYFEHERCHRVGTYVIVSVATTWGAPLLGGIASQTSAGFSLQFTILSSFFAVAVPALTLGAPETVFDRAYTRSEPKTNASYFDKSFPSAPLTIWSVEGFMDYAARMKPVSYQGDINKSILMQAPRAFIAPTTLLLFLVSFIPVGMLWSLASCASMLFSPLPFMLTPGSLGELMAGPWLFATAAVAFFAFFPWWHTNFNSRMHMIALFGGTALSFIGIIVFGLHLDACMTPPAGDEGDTSRFALDYLGTSVSFPVLSFLLGLLATGVYVLDAIVRPLIHRSTQFTSSNLGIARRNTTDMNAGVGFWRTLLSGILVISIPVTASSFDTLRALGIGLSIAQIIIVTIVGSAWYLWDENIRRYDGRAMRLVDLDILKRNGSFFDSD